jgi:hypothetical protein
MIIEAIIDFILGRVLDKIFPKKAQNIEIIKAYEERIKLLENEKDNRIKENSQIISTLKWRKFSAKRLIEKYHKPMNAIFISYASQFSPVPGKKPKKSAFIREELEKYHSKYLGGTDSIIPPRYVPTNIKDSKDLNNWFNKEILKDRFCKIKILALIDIRNKTTWGTYLHYKQKSPKHHTIGEILTIEDLISEKEIETLPLANLIRDGDILWLAGAILSEKELEIIKIHQDTIETKLGNPTLRELAKNTIEQRLNETLSIYLANPAEVSKKIIEEAAFWEAKLK